MRTADTGSPTEGKARSAPEIGAGADSGPRWASHGRGHKLPLIEDSSGSVRSDPTRRVVREARCDPFERGLPVAAGRPFTRKTSEVAEDP